MILTRELTGLVPDQAEVVHERYQDNKRNIMARVRRARSKMSSTPVHTSSELILYQFNPFCSVFSQGGVHCPVLLQELLPEVPFP